MNRIYTETNSTEYYQFCATSGCEWRIGWCKRPNQRDHYCSEQFNTAISSFHYLKQAALCIRQCPWSSDQRERFCLEGPYNYSQPLNQKQQGKQSKDNLWRSNYPNLIRQEHMVNSITSLTKKKSNFKRSAEGRPKPPCPYIILGVESICAEVFAECSVFDNRLYPEAAPYTASQRLKRTPFFFGPLCSKDQ